MLRLTPATRIIAHRVASPAGVLPAQVILPATLSTRPPLVVLHGISRNADELVDLFVPQAERSGRRIIVPHFAQDTWPVFQRPGKSARPDQALLALLGQLALGDAAMAGPVDLFGHSGGAQLAHRFAMLYPHKVRQLHLAAAGWYCLPDRTMAYPYGLGADATPGSLTWLRRHSQALPAYLRLCLRIYVGTNDTDRNDTLRQAPHLDQIQGPNRLARAATYVKHFRTAAQAHGIRPDIALTHLPGVTHDVAEAIRSAALDRLVLQDSAAQLALVS